MEWRLLADVPPDEVQRLLSIARRRHFRRGEVVFHRDDPADSLHLIVSGRFAVRVMTPLGDTATIAVRGPGESFGEIALLAEEHRRTATVEALEEAETFCVYEGEVARLRKEHPSIDRVLFAFLSAEVRMLNERLLEALYLPAERRVLRRLAELAEVYGSNEIAVTQEELAQLAGTSRATVNRVLREEQARGAIELRRGRTVVIDAGSMARWSR